MSSGFGFPSIEDTTVFRDAYILGYRFSENQAAWVYEELTSNRISLARSNPVKRSDDFRPDPLIPEEYRVRPEDYAKSGFDRGHMAPAGDMAWSAEAMSDSFYMSNMSPQRPACNRRTWKDLESAVRSWTMEYEIVEVFTGPIFGGIESIGPTNRQISVPLAYYKALYVPEHNEMIAFVVPNRAVTNTLLYFVRSIDEIEAVTGLDLFRDERLESTVNTGFWFKAEFDR